VPTCPDMSGAFWTVSTQALADVQPVSISGVTPTTHCASVEPPRPRHTSLTAARYTSSKVVSLPSTQHLIPRWSGCTTAAYAEEKRKDQLWNGIAQNYKDQFWWQWGCGPSSVSVSGTGVYWVLCMEQGHILPASIVNIFASECDVHFKLLVYFY